MNEREIPNGDCVWEDCDQAAEFCPGHALEYANVADENDAIRLRHAVTLLERQRDDLLGALRKLVHNVHSEDALGDACDTLLRMDLLIAAQKAEETARRRVL